MQESRRKAYFQENGKMEYMKFQMYALFSLKGQMYLKRWKHKIWCGVAWKEG